MAWRNARSSRIPLSVYHMWQVFDRGDKGTAMRSGWIGRPVHRQGRLLLSTTNIDYTSFSKLFCFHPHLITKRHQIVFDKAEKYMTHIPFDFEGSNTFASPSTVSWAKPQIHQADCHYPPPLAELERHAHFADRLHSYADRKLKRAAVLPSPEGLQ